MLSGDRDLFSGARTTLVSRTIEWSVELAHHSPRFREWALDRIAERLDSSYAVSNTTPEDMQLLRWLGGSLKAFFERLVIERPRAAKSLSRFLAMWAADVCRREDARRRGECAVVTVAVEPTDRCNLNCEGCYAKSTYQGSDLPYETLVELTREVTQMGATLVTLTGGEPFLREVEDQTISRLAEAFPDRGFLVYTNGTLISEETAKRLHDAGNVFPAISVEGYRNETDARRGRGCYSKTRAVRKLLADHQVMHGFSATVTSRNAELIADDDFIDRRIEEGDMFGWFFIYQPIGRRPDAGLMVSAAQRAKLREKIYHWRALNKPIFIGDFWNDGLLSEGCMAGGKKYFHIYANGDISPCVFSPVACGNVRDILDGKSEYATLLDFINRHPFFVAMREKQREITDQRAPCVLIDHPEFFREICRTASHYDGKNMPPDYLAGGAADVITQRAGEWNEKLKSMPVIPSECAVAAASDYKRPATGTAGRAG